MTAREKFDKGQRVEMTAEAIAQGLIRKKRLKFGTVIGFSLSSDTLVRVMIDGQSSGHTYHMDFWEPVKGARA